MTPPLPQWMAPARPSGLRVVSPEEGSPYPKCSLWLRGGARALDVLCATGVYLGAGRVGAVMTLLFVLLADGVLAGQSLGKRLFGVRVVHLPSRTPARFRDSVLRNGPFGLILLLGMLPGDLGRIGLYAGLVVIGGVEGLKVWRHALGIRLGDVWAETQVVDGKVVLGATVPAATGLEERAPGRMRVGGTSRDADRAHVQPEAH